MAVVVRVKRRLNDCQPQLLELTCKKQKFEKENNDNDPLTNVFKFAGTISSKDQKPLHVVKQAIGREKLKKEYQKCQLDPIIQSRCTRKQLALDSRYKIISHKRATNFDKLETECLPEEITNAKYQLIDLETDNEDLSAACYEDNDDITCNGVVMTKTKHDELTDDNDPFVYDLFYTNNKFLDYPALENILKIEAYREEELFMGYSENDEDEMANDEEDDENEENNWRNDYPDEDPKYYDSLDDNQDYGDDDDVGYGFDGDGRAGLAANNDISDLIDESTEHSVIDTLLVRGMTTTFRNFYR